MIALLLACAESTLPQPELEPVELVPGVAGDCDALYDPELLLSYQLQLDEEALTGLAVDDAAGEKNEHPARLAVEGEEAEAQVRLKGNPDFSWWTEKWQYVVSFDEEDPDARFHGLRALGFDAPWYDPTLLRDRLAWSIIAEVQGVHGFCATGATVRLNDEAPGVYAHVEVPDHEWLERSFGDTLATGTLWKYGRDPVSNAEAADPGPVEAFFAATTLDELEAVGSARQFALAWAVEAALGQTDGYWCCQNNFYLYDHPTEGVVFIPWDFDLAFEMSPYDTDPVEGFPQELGLFAQGPYRALVEDEDGRALYREALEDVLAALSDGPVASLDRWSEAMAEAVEGDVALPFEVDEHLAQTGRLRAWLPARVAWLESWLACDADQADDGDGDGYDDCADPDDGDASVNPGAAERCDGVDQDADGWIDDDPSCEDCVERSVDGARYLFCRAPRSLADAELRCAAAGLALVSMERTSDRYMTYVWTWPTTEPWWVSSDAWGCRGWEGDHLTRVGCDEEHPVVCG